MAHSLSHLTDSLLLSEIKKLVVKERELLTDVLDHLREIDRRRLYSALRYKSLFEYAVKELGYSEDSAYRRINAMKLVRELPELEAKINSGNLTLSTLNAATQVFRAEQKAQGHTVAVPRKLELLAQIENKSRREAEGVLQSMTTAPKELLKPEKIKVIDEIVEIQFRAKKTLSEKICRVKDILSHSCPGISTAELFEKLCDDLIEKHQKSMTVKNRLVQSEYLPKPQAKSLANQKQRIKYPRRYLSVHIKREIWQKSKGRCTNCGSQSFLEIDHVLPLAMGGGDETSNLRLLCRRCNQRAAIEKLGQTKMQRFLDGNAK